MQRNRMTDKEVQANREQARRRMKAGNHPAVQAARDGLANNRDTGQGQQAASPDTAGQTERSRTTDLSGQLRGLAAARAGQGRGTQEAPIGTRGGNGLQEGPLPSSVMNLMQQLRRRR